MDRRYDLPALPNLTVMYEALQSLKGTYSNISKLISNSSRNSTASDRLIPRVFWITMKNVSKNYQDLPDYTRHYLDYHEEWKSVIADDDDADEFMRTVFSNTSLLWAYETLNPLLGAAKADLWRYAVLYGVGGVYIDADACFWGNIDAFIKPTDKFILSIERNRLIQCYQPSYHLHSTPEMLGNHTMIQWLLISAPQHPFIAQTILNVVEVIKSIHLSKSVLVPAMSYFHDMICTTGPPIFTYSVRQIVSSSTADLGYRFDKGADFKSIGGSFKAGGKDPPNHYSKILRVKGTALLKSYLSEPGERSNNQSNWPR